MSYKEEDVSSLAAMLRGECPECGKRGEMTISGRGSERVRYWTCDRSHDESSWDEESVAQHLFEMGWSEDAVKDFLRCPRDTRSK